MRWSLTHVNHSGARGGHLGLTRWWGLKARNRFALYGFPWPPNLARPSDESEELLL